MSGKIKKKKDHLAELYNKYDIPEWFSYYELSADYNTVYLEGRPISTEDFVELLQLSEE